MPRHPRTEHQPFRHAHRTTLALAILIASSLANIAEAAPPPPPVFQGTFTAAGMCSPRGVGISPSGEVYVGSDCVGPQMMRFTGAGALIGTWGFPPGYLGSPNGVAVDGLGNVYVTDYDGNKLHKYTFAGALGLTWNTLAQPVDIAVSGAGEVYVVELLAKRVQKFTDQGVLVSTIGSSGGGPGQFTDPVGICVDASGRFYVADATRKVVLRFLSNGAFDTEFATPLAPYDVAEGADGHLYIAFAENNTVRQYTTSGTLVQSLIAPAGLDLPYRVACGPTGSIYVVEQGTHRVTRFQMDAITPATRTTFARLKAMYR